MIFRLIQKDLKAYGRIIVLNFLIILIAGNVFVLRYYPWHVYMMYGYLTLAILSSLFSLFEKNRNTEVMTCSLPVQRSSVVTARYLTSAALFSVGLLFWYMNGLVGTLLHSDAVTDYSQIAQLKVVFMAILFILIHISIFLPASLRLKFVGIILTFIIALTAAAASVSLIFRPYRHSYNPYFESGDFNTILLLIMIMITAPLISFLFSLKLYKSKDI